MIIIRFESHRQNPKTDNTLFKKEAILIRNTIHFAFTQKWLNLKIKNRIFFETTLYPTVRKICYIIIDVISL